MLFCRIFFALASQNFPLLTKRAGTPARCHSYVRHYIFFPLIILIWVVMVGQCAVDKGGKGASCCPGTACPQELCQAQYEIPPWRPWGAVAPSSYHLLLFLPFGQRSEPRSLVRFLPQRKATWKHYPTSRNVETSWRSPRESKSNQQVLRFSSGG